MVTLSGLKTVVVTINLPEQRQVAPGRFFLWGTEKENVS